MKRLRTVFVYSLIFLVFSMPLEFHAKDLDSLKIAWENQSNSDTLRLNALWGYTTARIMKCDHDSLALLGQQLYDFALNIDYKKYQSRGLFMLGYAKLFSRDYPASKAFFIQSIKIDSAIGSKWMMGRKYIILGQIGTSMFDYSAGHNYLDTAFQIFEVLKDTQQMAFIYLSQGFMNSEQGKYAQALSCFSNGFDLSQKIGDEKGMLWNKGNIATVFVAQGKYDTALQIHKESYAYFEELGQKNELAVTYRSMGELLSKLGNYGEALEQYNKSIEIYEDFHMPDIIAGILLAIGDDFVEQGRYSEALDNYEEGLQTYENMKLKSGIAGAYESLGYLNFKLESYQQSLKYYRMSLGIFQEIGHKSSEAEAFGKIGGVFSKQQLNDSAKIYYERSLKINEEIEREGAISDNCKDFGDLYMGQGEYEKAGEYYNKSRIIREKNGDIVGTGEIYADIGRMHIVQNNIEEGVKWCQKGFDIAIKYGLVKIEQGTSHCLYIAHKEMGNSEQALKYYELSHLLVDSLNIDEVAIRIKQLEFARERAEDSLAIVEENLKSELAYQGKLTKEKNTRNTFMFGGVGILLLAGGLFSRTLYIRKTNRQLELKNLIIAREKDKAEASEKAKEQFFDNVSHEFKTPLTLILGPLNEAMEKTNDDRLKPGLETMQRNALRLQGMIDELLDLSKLEFGKVKLNAREEEIVKFTQEYLQSFESLADQKKIRLNFKSEIKGQMLWVDPDKMRKILANLLSNAFKFTKAGGEINVQISSRQSSREGAAGLHVWTNGHNSPINNSKSFMTNDQLPMNSYPSVVVIQVSDTGLGIPNEKLPHIFDRFYQVGDPTQQYLAGTGIGLALTKELIEMHCGLIEVESKPGKGTIFTVFIPTGRDHLSGEDLANDDQTDGEMAEHEEINQPIWVVEKEIAGKVSEEEVKKKHELPTLLIVEDNEDMRSYIKTHLTAKYTILEAGDGEEGLQMALDSVPDLVISDVMMPKMDGYEMAEKLKTDVRTSHIPVIILTARDSLDNRIEGLEAGADDYITKPFNSKELKVRVKNLISQRENLKEIYSRSLEVPEMPLLKDKEIPLLDQQFLIRAVQIINSRMADPEFDVKSFAADMSLSRVQLHRKFKALSNKTTSEFIRTVRLNRAAQLLKTHTGNVTEVAYETGFSSLSWFARVFKEQFGESPSNYNGFCKTVQKEIDLKGVP